MVNVEDSPSGCCKKQKEDGSECGNEADCRMQSIIPPIVLTCMGLAICVPCLIMYKVYKSRHNVDIEKCEEIREPMIDDKEEEFLRNH